MNRNFTTIAAIFCLAGSLAPAGESRISVGMPHSIFAGLNPGDAKLTMTQILKMAGFGKHQLEVTLVENHVAFEAAIREERIDFFPILSLDFLRFGVELGVHPAAVSLAAGNDPRSSLVLLTARQESTNLSDFSGAQLVVDESHTFGLERIWLETLLVEAGLGSPEEVFPGLTNVNKPAKALLPAFFGQSDLCLVTRRDWELMAELNPQLKSRLKPVAESEPLLCVMMAFRKNYDAQRRQRFIADITRLHETPAGKQVLTVTKTERIAVFRPEWLEETRRLFERHRELTEKPQPEVANR